jgi:phosphomannomutase
VRPSGTEPKIKFYVLARGTMGADRGGMADRQAVNELYERVRGELTGLAADIAGRSMPAGA